MFPRVLIKRAARERLSDYFSTSMFAYVITELLSLASGFLSWGVGTIFIRPPLMVGQHYFGLMVYRGNKPELSQVFEYGFNDYLRKLGGVLWSYIFIMLWMMALVVPGIVKAIAYSMTPYLLTEYPNINSTDAVKISMRITYGHKADIFMLYLSFIGWFILGACTAGLSHLLYSGPYLNITLGGVYDKLKQEALEQGRITPRDLGIQ